MSATALFLALTTAFEVLLEAAAVTAAFTTGNNDVAADVFVEVAFAASAAAPSPISINGVIELFGTITGTMSPPSFDIPPLTPSSELPPPPSTLALNSSDATSTACFATGLVDATSSASFFASASVFPSDIAV